jgi:outer membrane protein TolC
MSVRHTVRVVVGPAVLVAAACAGPALRAQDSLTLAAAQAAAAAADPRGLQGALLREQSGLRLTSLDAERRPQLALGATAFHQSDVTAITLALPGGSPPRPPRDRWSASIDLEQVLYDGGAVGRRAAVERARLAEAIAGVDAARWRLRSEVNAAFFQAFLLQQRIAELELLLGDLDARLAEVRARVRNGAALPRDSAAILAEQLKVAQGRTDAVAARRAALAVLARATGRVVRDDVQLVLPDLAPPVRDAMAADPAQLRARPEFAQWQRMRDRLDREATAATLENRPRVALFGQAGYGRPGLNQLRPDATEFWIAGIRASWRPFTWRTADRSAESLRLQRRVLESEERAFAEGLARAIETDRADLDRLAGALDTDDRVIALRTLIEAQARRQFDEGVLTAAQYLDARTDVAEARLDRQRHVAERAQAQARLLTTLGIALP